MEKLFYGFLTLTLDTFSGVSTPRGLATQTADTSILSLNIIIYNLILNIIISHNI